MTREMRSWGLQNANCKLQNECGEPLRALVLFRSPRPQICNLIFAICNPQCLFLLPATEFNV